MVAINKLGGIIMLFSLFLPIVLVLVEDRSIFLWLFGLHLYIINGQRETYAFPDVIGFIMFFVFLVFSIICITKDPGTSKTLGILSMVFIIIFYIEWLVICTLHLYTFNVFPALGEPYPTFIVIPFIGFFGVIIGSILNIAAK